MGSTYKKYIFTVEKVSPKGLDTEYVLRSESGKRKSYSIPLALGTIQVGSQIVFEHLSDRELSNPIKHFEYVEVSFHQQADGACVLRTNGARLSFTESALKTGCRESVERGPMMPSIRREG